MKQKSFYAWLMISAVVFAVISLGGCGGSSSNLADVGGGTEEVAVSMSDVWQDQKAAEEVVGKLNSGDIFLLLTVKMETIEKKSDGSVTMKYYNMADSVFHDADNPKVPYNAAEVLAHYNSGDIIVLMNTDIIAKKTDLRTKFRGAISPPQAYPGSLCRTLLVSILLYEQPQQI